jgi:hypothetical protein
MSTDHVQRQAQVWVKQAGREADHSLPSSMEVTNECGHNSLRSVWHREGQIYLNRANVRHQHSCYVPSVRTTVLRLLTLLPCGCNQRRHVTYVHTADEGIRATVTCVLHMFVTLDFRGLNDIRLISGPIHVPSHEFEGSDTNMPLTNVRRLRLPVEFAHFVLAVDCTVLSQRMCRSEGPVNNNIDCNI